ncbi:putative G-protein coupled receptor 25 [Galemys pyrenaicus]|uniref:Probable G-protein coupled receptor 25 n=1 Tax=Galemys pyrenaicus TaxID=202257 RepID=A0A8J6ABH1_GALPY|nr:putative G-protein coupled receptor 25 [Galemys pyrenaicus]
MPHTEPWSSDLWSYSGSGSGYLEELEECLSGDLPYSYAYIPVLYLVAFAVGLLGNAFVVWLLAGRRGPRRLVDTFVLHLAAADLGFVLTLPLWAAATARGGLWPFGQGLCKLSSFALATTRCAGALLLAGMSVDRYLAVVKLIDARLLRTRRCALAVCGSVWAVALLAGLPALAYRGLQPLPGGHGSQCGEAPSDAFQILSLLLLLLTFVLPMGVTLFCYCLILRRLRRAPHMGRARGNSLRLIFAIESAFVGSWLPLCALRTLFHLARLRLLPLPCRLLLALRWGLTLTTCLAFVNSCANPVIYLLLDRSFRTRLRRQACECAGRGPRRASSASSLSSHVSSVFWEPGLKPGEQRARPKEAGGAPQSRGRRAADFRAP